VVGHVEQMHLSRCYQASSTFSCLTCHDPHGEPAPADRVPHYQAVCLSCHRLESCTVGVARRKHESPANDCVQCHMPQAATDITHLAFTHHRVGIHRQPDGADGDNGDAGELRPFLPFPELNAIDRDLALGQAYRALSIRGKDPRRRPEWAKRALALLTAVHLAGLRDADLEAGLAQLTFDMKTGNPLAHAQSALAHPELAGQSRCDALFVRSQLQASAGQYTAAAADMRELTQLRRRALDWLFLASHQRALGDEDAAREAMKVAVRIDPRQGAAHRHLADYYRQQGDAERAAWHEQRAVP
jgi:predicted CXXCH cytochrome family protein